VAQKKNQKKKTICSSNITVNYAYLKVEVIIGELLYETLRASLVSAILHRTEYRNLYKKGNMYTENRTIQA